MPLTPSGQKVMSSMTKQYGAKRGKAVFFAAISKGAKGSKKWHKTKVTGKQRLQALGDK